MMRMRRNIFGRRWVTKGVSVFLLVFEAIFLNVIVPGHTRGAITLTGKIDCRSLADLGCPCCARDENHSKQKGPSRQDRSECAICHLAVRMFTAVPVDFRLGELGLLELIPPPAPEATPVVATLSVHYCRGPPAISI
jgi:hypothetical protein